MQAPSTHSSIQNRAKSLLDPQTGNKGEGHFTGRRPGLSKATPGRACVSSHRRERESAGPPPPVGLQHHRESCSPVGLSSRVPTRGVQEDEGLRSEVVCDAKLTAAREGLTLSSQKQHLAGPDSSWLLWKRYLRAEKPSRSWASSGESAAGGLASWPASRGVGGARWPTGTSPGGGREDPQSALSPTPCADLRSTVSRLCCSPQTSGPLAVPSPWRG